MNPLSSVLRLVFGLIIVVMSVLQYRSMKAHLAEGGTPQLFGHVVGLSATGLTVLFVILGLVGLVLLIAGAKGLARR
jgi:hypothetical protein